MSHRFVATSQGLRGSISMFREGRLGDGSWMDGELTVCRMRAGHAVTTTGGAVVEQWLDASKDDETGPLMFRRGLECCLVYTLGLLEVHLLEQAVYVDKGVGCRSCIHLIRGLGRGPGFRPDRQNGSVGTRSRVISCEAPIREWKECDGDVTRSNLHPTGDLLESNSELRRAASNGAPSAPSPIRPIMAAVLPRSPSFASLSSAHDVPADIDTPRSPKVRFDHDCVVIPDPTPTSRLPRLVTKSYSLPLWKRKRDPSQVSEPENEAAEDHVVFKVSVPRSVSARHHLVCSRNRPRIPSPSLQHHNQSSLSFPRTISLSPRLLSHPSRSRHLPFSRT